MNRNYISGTALLIVALIFVTATFLINRYLSSARLDLTENQLYTLSDGTKNILSQIDEPVNLYFFYSEKIAKEIPYLQNHATRVRETLEEYASLSNNKINLKIIDPEPFSEAEDRALDFGLKGVPTSSGDDIYFGLVGTNSLDSQEIIPFFQPNNSSFLEYELSKLVYTLSNPKKPVIGLVSSLPIQGVIDPISGKRSNSWVIYDQLKALFDIRLIDPGFKKIDDSIDTVIVIHPKQMDEASQYALDQFILNGGKALVFVDPYAEIELANSQNQFQERMSDKSSSLDKLFAAWGIEFSRTDILGDEAFALPVSVSYDSRPITHLSVVGFTEQGFNTDDVITSQFSAVNVAHGGFIKLTEESTLTENPLIISSEKSGVLPVDRVKFTMDPTQLRDVFKPDSVRRNLAVRLQGKIKSAFTTAPEQAHKDIVHKAESDGEVNMIVVADVDLLQDRLWVRVQNFLGQKIATPFANNADFVINCVDNLSGSNDLINIRGRGDYRRPFDYVNDLRKQAEAQYRDTEKELMARLEATEQKIASLQQERENQNALFLTPEQEAAINEFRDEKTRIRKQLRNVRHQLNEDIENLGTRLWVINVIGIPTLVFLIGIIVAVIHLKRRYR